MDGILMFLTIAGAIALFLFGMKLMSESLQKLMGERIRKVLSEMTTNKYRGVLTGLVITFLIQSSSATTVMVVSFVNAGILRLAEAVSLIIGANIGTTFTAWLIAIFGFEINFAIYTLPLIGLSIPLIFSNKRQLKNVGEMFLGFSLIFIALNFLKQSIPAADQQSRIFEAIHYIANWGYGSYLIFLFIAAIFTVIIKSSNSIFALTLVLAFNGWITFDLAVAMVLGENIGTTIATISAARVANFTAKRAALAHLCFNLFGVTWVIIFFPFLIQAVSSLYMYLGGGNPMTSHSNIPMALTLFHTLFNLINTVLVIGFTKQIAQFIIRRIPSGGNSSNEFRLTHIKMGVLSTPDASLYQALRETTVFAEKVRKMFMNVERIFDETNENEYKVVRDKILASEEYSNRLETEIANYLTKVGEGRLSETSSQRMRALYKMIDDIESIADSCTNISNVIEQKRIQKLVFPDHINNNVHLIFNMVRDSLDMMVTMLTHDDEVPLSMAHATESEINDFRDILKSEHLNNLEKGIYKYEAGIIYNDIVSQCERIGDFAINVDEAFKGLFKH
ncbi:MAG: Na/Pi cotransporter family protein [Prolixibacteraceae bacterium]